ncbi:MAG: hypothetical protein V4723_02910 [Pseudomonadota bacterium]
MNAMNKQKALSVLLLAAALSGCASSSPQWESSFGNSVRASMAAQVIDPAAVRNTDPVSGIDNHAAAGIVSQYTVAYAKPAVAPAPMTTGKAR